VRSSTYADATVNKPSGNRQSDKGCDDRVGDKGRSSGGRDSTWPTSS
jgi:hypothetical protein